MQSGLRAEGLPALTSLRFIAAMMIVLYHCRLYAFDWPWVGYVPATLDHGVSFFFVLSGFILTHVYGARPWPGNARFVALRLGRIWPVHSFATMILLAAIPLGDAIIRHDSITFDGEGIFSRWFALGLQATLTQSLSPYRAHILSWNGPAWTISTELCFYVIFPFLLPHVRRAWPLVLGGAALVLLAAATAIHVSGLPLKAPSIEQLSQSSLSVANPLMRGFEFCLGMAAWVLWTDYLRPRQWSALTWTAAELAAVALLTAWIGSGVVDFLMRSEFAYEWLHLSSSCWAFAILIVVMASNRGYLARLLSFRAFVFLGEISYAVYILHMILMKVFFTHNLLSVSEIVFFAVLLGVSAATYLLVERPARDAVRNVVTPPGAMKASAAKAELVEVSTLPSASRPRRSH